MINIQMTVAGKMKRKKEKKKTEEQKFFDNY